MLTGINPLLSPDLLHALRAMGHRHDIAIVDANFPCDPARQRVVRLDGITATDALDAVLSVLPLEKDEPQSAWRMIAYDDPSRLLPIFAEFSEIVDQYAPGIKVHAIPPTEFKAVALDAYVVVVTGERRLYGGIVVRKGVIPPPGE